MFENALDNPRIALARGILLIIYGLNFASFVAGVYDTAALNQITGLLLLFDAVMLTFSATMHQNRRPNVIYGAEVFFTAISGLALVLLTAPTHLFTLHFVALALVLTGILQLWVSVLVIVDAQTLLVMRAVSLASIILGIVLPVVPISQDDPLLIGLAVFLIARGGLLIFWSRRQPVSITSHASIHG